jgi:hypothetical protein
LTVEAAAERTATARPRSSLRAVLGFSLLYAIGAVVSVAIGCLAAGWQADGRLWSFLGIVAAGSFLAAGISWPSAALVSRRRPPTARFAAMLIGLTLSTALITAFLFFLQHFFAPGMEHAPVFTRWFLVELFYSGLSTTYLFAVTGLRLFFPVGLLVMVLASYAFAVRREL